MHPMRKSVKDDLHVGDASTGSGDAETGPGDAATDPSRHIPDPSERVKTDTTPTQNAPVCSEVLPSNLPSSPKSGTFGHIGQKIGHIGYIFRAHGAMCPAM